VCSLWHEDTLGLDLGYSYYESGVSYSGRGGISPTELFDTLDLLSLHSCDTIRFCFSIFFVRL
jgi:hypothetical protein